MVFLFDHSMSSHHDRALVSAEFGIAQNSAFRLSLATVAAMAV
jgi:hypothetical protein